MARGAYVGVLTDIPIYQTETKTTSITASNISTYFTVTNSTYYFNGSGSTFTTTNGGVASSTASTKLTAKFDMDVSFTYSYASESNYDKFTLVVAGTTVANALSGAPTSKTYSGSIQAGDVLDFSYVKDGSQDSNGDKCTFSGMSITYTEKTQTGSESKEVARKIRKNYIGIDDVARRIRKAYLGIGGVARPAWSFEAKVDCYGTIAGLSSPRAAYAATTLGDCVLFGGGTTQYTESTSGGSWSSAVADVDRYTKTLTKLGNLTLSSPRAALAAATIGSKALFAGGSPSDYSGESNTVDTFDSSGTRGSADPLSRDRYGLSSAKVGNYALFASGRYHYSSGTSYYVSNAYYVDIYDSSLTHQALTAANTSGVECYRPASASFGSRAIFAGGATTTTQVGTLIYFTETLSRGVVYNAIGGSSGTKWLTATNINDKYLVFYGGNAYQNSSHLNRDLKIYDSSLTTITVDYYIYGGQSPASASVHDFAVFAGGQDLDSDPRQQAYSIDSSLTYTRLSDITGTSVNCPGASIKNYMLFPTSNGDVNVFLA